MGAPRITWGRARLGMWTADFNLTFAALQGLYLGARGTAGINDMHQTTLSNAPEAPGYHSARSENSKELTTHKDKVRHGKQTQQCRIE